VCEQRKHGSVGAGAGNRPGYLTASREAAPLTAWRSAATHPHPSLLATRSPTATQRGPAAPRRIGLKHTPALSKAQIHRTTPARTSHVRRWPARSPSRSRTLALRSRLVGGLNPIAQFLVRQPPGGEVLADLLYDTLVLSILERQSAPAGPTNSRRPPSFAHQAVPIGGLAVAVARSTARRPAGAGRSEMCSGPSASSICSPAWRTPNGRMSASEGVYSRSGCGEADTRVPDSEPRSANARIPSRAQRLRRSAATTS